MKKLFNYFMVLALSLTVSCAALTSCGDDKDEPKEEVPGGGNSDNEVTDELSNTSWRGDVDGVSVTLIFRTGGRCGETALGETVNGTYQISGNTLKWDVYPSILRNSYGPRYTFKKTSSRLTLTDDYGTALTFTLI